MEKYALATPKDLLAGIEHHLNQFSGSPNVRKSFEKWQQNEMSNLTYQLDKITASQETDLDGAYLHILKDYMAYFDILLFSGSINQLRASNQKTPLKKMPAISTKVLGETRSGGVDGRDVSIAVSPPYVFESYLYRKHVKFSAANTTLFQVSDEDILRYMLGTLLHELAHAFFYLYSQKSEREDLDAPDCLGKTCHGKCWVDLAKIIERFMEEVLGLKVDLCIEQAEAKEQAVARQE